MARPDPKCRCCGAGASQLCKWCQKNCVMQNGPGYILIPSDRRTWFNPHGGRRSNK